MEIRYQLKEEAQLTEEQIREIEAAGITLTLKMRILLRLIRKRILICMKAS